MFQLNTHNHFPDCLLLQIVTAVSPDTPQQHHLNLTLQFNQQWHSLLQGRIKFGLKGGELHLKIDRNALELRDRPQTFSSSLTPANIPIRLEPQNTTDEPTWELSSTSSQPILQGDMTLSPWVVLQQYAPPEYLQASFTVKPHQVYLTDAENLWRHNISPNQHAILDRIVVNALIQQDFATPLSLVTLATPDSATTTPPSAAFNELQKQIELISSAQPDNFFDLAALAALDPKNDFAGGNLRGTELNGIDLSNANLVGVNFRGAELCDCDFSEANLQSANLRGADLSGAYLENANLSHSDLQRASLALANLADADLRGANLQQANLSQTNLSHAAVVGARFSENSGLNPKTVESLKERGAVFS